MNEEEKSKIAIDPNEAVINDKGFFGHPKGVGSLAAGNMCNSFAWAAVYAVLIYYLYSPFTKGLGFTQGQAATMIAAMGAANGLFVIVGSWLSDRVMGSRSALVIGNIVKAAAFGMFALPTVTIEQGRVFAIIGLVLMSMPIMGASNSSLTGLLYRREDGGRRDAAFTIHTVANAIAGVIAPILIGNLSANNYHIGFAIGAAWALAYGMIIFVTRNKFFGTIGAKPVNPLNKAEKKKFIIIAAVVVVVGAVLIGGTMAMKILSFDGIINVLTTAAFLIPILFLTQLFRNKKISAEDHKRLPSFLKLWLVQVIVMVASSMISSAVAVFLDAKVDRMFLGYEFAPATFTSIYNVFGLIAGPIFVWLWTATKAQRIKTSKKFAIGIFWYALSYAILSVPVMFALSGKVSPIIPIIYYLLMCFGDNMVFPIGNSMTAKLAPKSYETQMQSAWSQATTVGNAVTIILFKFFTTSDSQLRLFPIMAVVLAIAGISVFMLSNNIEKGLD